MNLRKPLDLEVYWQSSVDCQLEDLGIKTDSIPEKKTITFYTIDHTYKGIVSWEDKECGVIRSGGEEYATVLTYEQLKGVISRCL